MNVLVTGATGFVGSHLCKELIQRGYYVFGLSRSGKIQNIQSLLNKKRFHLERGDIRDIDMLSSIVKDDNIKVIFHLATQLPHINDLNDPSLLVDINVRGTLNSLNVAYKNGVDKFIYASSMSVYSEPPKYLPVDEKHPVQPPTIYGASKLSGELYCHVYSKSMGITILRYAGCYGKGQPKHNAVPRFINQALNNKSITIYGNGTQSSDFVYVKDVVQGTLLALEKNMPGIYNIGSGEETNIRDLAKQIISLTNSKSKLIQVDVETDRPFRFALDIQKSRKVLGYFPLSVNEGLSKYISEFENNKSQ